MNAAVPIRILLIDDHVDWCQTLTMLLELESDLKVVGVEHDAGDLLGAVDRFRPAVLLIDMSMPGREPLSALQEAIQIYPSLRAVVLSGYDDPDHMARAHAAGAVKYLTKAADPDLLVREIRRAANAPVPAAGCQPSPR